MKELMTRREVAKTFKVTIETVYNWTKSGKLKIGCTINGRPRYLKEDIEKLITNKKDFK